MSNTPQWVIEESFIQHLLHTMLDKVERGVNPYIRVDEKSAPDLYRFNEEDTDYLWDLVTRLDYEYHVLTIKNNNKRFPEAPYHKNQLYLVEDKIPLVREWLDRPALDPYSKVWDIMVDEYSKKIPAHYCADLTLLSGNAIRYGHKSAEQIVKAFSCIPEELNRNLNLRTLSAKCFWGDSKFLDSRRSLVKTLFPQQAHFLQKRPVMINVYLAQEFEQVLFIENQDSFLEMKQACEEQSAKVALIYSAGFKGSAQRIRKPQAVVWSYLNKVDAETVNRFTYWWFNDTPEHIPVYFWGDLDLSAMSILAALRLSFPQLRAWQPGYKAMLKYFEKGLFHRLSEAGKQKQQAPLDTGCAYADEVLLPLLRHAGECVDQEIVTVADGYFSEHKLCEN